MTRKMKESGVEWIGEIPDDWSITRLIYLSKDEPNSIVDGPFGSDLKNEEYVDFGIPIVQLNNINAYNHNLSNKVYISEKKAKALSRHIAISGDIVIAKMMPAGRSCILKNDFKEYIVSADCIRCSLNNRYNSHFVLYSLNSYIIEEAGILSKGSTRQRINLSLVKKFRIIDPPLPTQNRIASFLDTKCSLIDSTIEKEREVIDKLKEYRQAVITEAVTKGIRAGVPMKDSGVEWIGEIPEGWNKRKLNGLLRSIGSGTTPKSNPLYYDGEYPWLNTGDLADDFIQNVNKTVTELAIQDHSPLKLYDAPSVVIALYGATIGKLGITTYPLTVNQACCVMTTKPDLDYKYLFYALLGIRKYLFILSYGAGQPNISGETIKSLQIPHPPVSEQHEIADYLDTKCSDIDATIQKRELAIEKLTAYKQSLIYECVTGKKEVLG